MSEIEDVRIKLSALWVSLMLTYLLGDVLRIFSGDFEAGEVGGVPVSQGLYLGLAVLLTLPVVMVFLSLTLPYSVNRRANAVVAAFLFVFNLVGLPTYPSLYDQFLIVVGLGFDLLIVRYAWTWKRENG